MRNPVQKHNINPPTQHAMLYIKFDEDWPISFRDYYTVWKLGFQAMSERKSAQSHESLRASFSELKMVDIKNN